MAMLSVSRIHRTSEEASPNSRKRTSLSRNAPSARPLSALSRYREMMIAAVRVRMAAASRSRGDAWCGDGKYRANVPTTLRSSVSTGKDRSEEHTSELQSLRHLVCRLLLEK